MTPQKQAFRHIPEEGQIGDCHRTCYACLLDLPRDSIPNFAEVGFNITEEGESQSAGFNEACAAWLSERGLAEVQIPFACDLPEVLTFMARVNPGVHYILGGHSRTGVNHSVIGLNDQIIWDPSLTDAGIVGPCEPDGHYWVSFLAHVSPTSVALREIGGGNGNP